MRRSPFSSAVGDERYPGSGNYLKLRAALLSAWKVSDHVRDILLLERKREREKKKEKEAQDEWGMIEDRRTEEDKGVVLCMIG